MSVFEKSSDKSHISVKSQTVATVLAVMGAVAIPQIFHVIGEISGLGTALGKIFLPMHLPVMIAGFIAGTYSGAISGLIGPLASCFLNDMPDSVMLPFMMAELCAYGTFAGFLKNIRIPSVLKVITVQLAGRIVRACAIFLAVYLFKSESVKIASVWNNIFNDIPGLILQWSLIPFIVHRTDKSS